MMGFYNQFPYMNSESLNIDWVLHAVHKADETLKDLNKRIETVVRPMINEQNQFYTRLIQNAETQMRNQTAALQSEVRTATQLLNRSVYESNQKVDAALTKINIDLARQSSHVESELSKSLNEMRNTLSYYSAVFSSGSVAAQSQLNSIIRDYDMQLRILLEGEKASMAALKLEINNQISAAMTELSDTELELKSSMALLERNVGKQNDMNLKMLNALGEQLTKQMTDAEADLGTFYRYFQQMYDGIWSLMDYRISLKADKSYVDEQIKRVESLITITNGEIQLINPATGQTDGLQKILYDIYRAGNPLALTAGEYDDLKIKAGDYDDMRLTAYQYDHYARWYLILYKEVWDYVHEYVDDSVKPLEDKIDDAVENLQAEIDLITEKCETCCTQLNQDVRMFNPFTGDFDLIKDVVNSLLNSVRINALSAGEYDDKHLSAGQYDDMHLSAFDYDWNGKILLGGI